MTEELKIGIDLDRSSAQQSTRAFSAEQKKAAEQMAGDLSNAEGKAAAAASKAQASKRRAIGDTLKTAMSASAQEGTAVTGVGSKVSKAAGEFTKLGTAAKKASVDGVAGLVKMGAAAGVMTMAVQKAIGVVKGLGAAMAAAGAKSRQQTNQFIDKRESMAELANIRGEVADNAFVLRQAQFNKRTGLTTEESVAGQTEFQNTAAQHIGKDKGQISQAQADKLQEGAAKLALSKGIAPSVVMGMAGTMLGSKDYSKFGDKAADTALADLNSTMSVNAAGSGDNAQLASETQKLMAATQSDDDTRGIFKKSSDVAKMISVMSEGFTTGGQSEATEAVIRGIRGKSEFLGKAGVEKDDDLFTALGKINKQANEDLKTAPKGTKLQDIIKSEFKDELVARGMNVALSRGVQGGLFDQREAVAQANATPEAAQAQIADYDKSERGKVRKASAGVEYETLKRSSENSELEVVRRQAMEKLIRDRAIDTDSSAAKGYLNGEVSFGMMGDVEQKQVDDESQRIIDARSPAGTKKAPFSDMANMTELQRQDDLKRRMGRAREAGGDPLAERGGEDDFIKKRRDQGVIGGAMDWMFGGGEAEFAPPAPNAAENEKKAMAKGRAGIPGAPSEELPAGPAKAAEVPGGEAPPVPTATGDKDMVLPPAQTKAEVWAELDKRSADAETRAGGGDPEVNDTLKKILDEMKKQGEKKEKPAAGKVPVPLAGPPPRAGRL